MTVARPPLPQFERPPVVEVTLSVQFEPLIALRNPHIGLFWSEIRKNFPLAEERPPLPPTYEWFGVQAPHDSSLKVEVMQVPPVSRAWFLNRHGSELVQVQQDRFIVNWRKATSHEKYPRYEYVERLFASNFKIFQDFVASEGLGSIQPNQCEITYVNHILSGEGWDRPGELARVVTVWAPEYSDEFLSEPEDARLAVRYAIRDEKSDEPFGRLNIIVEPRQTSSSEKNMLLVVLTARGKPQGTGAEGVLNFFRLGRKWIVRGFTSMTSKSMHKIWGRYDNS